MNPYDYIIDGYNMLFRLMPSVEKSLQTGRDFIILDLNKKISLLNLNVSIVFDAHFQMGGSTRSHFDQIEVLFTAEGETADEYILEKVEESPFPEKIMVVTSDKQLALRVRHLDGNVQSVEEFLEALNRAYQNRFQEKKKRDRRSPSIGSERKELLKISQKLKRKIPDRDAPVGQCEAFYEQIFLERLKKLEAIDNQKRDERKEKKRFPRPNKAKKLAAPFSSDEVVELDEAGQMERWLKIFEQRINQHEI